MEILNSAVMDCFWQKDQMACFTINQLCEHIGNSSFLSLRFF